jgi:transcriptional regulator with XRE-family HTH domain
MSRGADFRRRQRDRAFAKWAEDVLAHPERYLKLKVARTQAGLTQSELGELACLAAGHISDIERGRKAHKHSRQLLARALKIKESDLFDADA